MELNKGLNLDAIPEITQTGDFRFASNITLDNTYRFPINEHGMESIDIRIDAIRGVISFDNGFAIFAQESKPTIYVIKTNYETSPKERIYKKLILSSSINFDINNPIRGTYIYNQNKHLNIIFSCGVDGSFEDKIIDIDAYGIEQEYTLSDAEMYRLDINPTVKYPQISSSVTSGYLKTGAYQIAVCYKVDKDYTNYSLLSLPEFVYGTKIYDKASGKEGLAPNSESTFGIDFVLENLDLNYTHYRIAILYNDGTTYIVKTTEDIKTSVKNFNLKDLDVYATGSLTDTITNSIFYSNSESLDIMNNRLYRANLKSNTIRRKQSDGTYIYFDDVAQQVASNVNLELVSSNIELYSLEEDSIKKYHEYVKFQNDEVYALYLTLGDKKGNVLGSYPINSQRTNAPYLVNHTQSTLNIIHHSLETVENKITLIQGSTTNGISYEVTEEVPYAQCTVEYTDPSGAQITYDDDDHTAIAITATLPSIKTTDTVLNIRWKYTTYQFGSITYDTTITVPAGQLSHTTLFDEAYLPYNTYLYTDFIYSNLILCYVHLNTRVVEDKHFEFKIYQGSTLGETVTVMVPAGDDTAFAYTYPFSFTSYTVTNDLKPIQTYVASLDFIIDVRSNFKLKRYDMYNNLIGEFNFYIDSGNIRTSFSIEDYAEDHCEIEILSAIDKLILRLYFENVPLKTGVLTYRFIDNFNTILDVDFDVTQNVKSTSSKTVTMQGIKEYNSLGGVDINMYRMKFYTDDYMTGNVPITLTCINDGVIYKTEEVIFLENTKIAYSNYFHKLSGTFTFDLSYGAIPGSASDRVDYYSVCREFLVNNSPDKHVYTENHIKITLPTNINYILGEFKDVIGFWCIHRAQRTNSNSKINCQAIMTSNFHIELKNDDYVVLYPPKSDTNVSHLFYETVDNPAIVGPSDLGIRAYSFEDIMSENTSFDFYNYNIISKYSKSIYDIIHDPLDSTKDSVLFNTDDKRRECPLNLDTFNMRSTVLGLANSSSVENQFHENCRMSKAAGIFDIPNYFYTDSYTVSGYTRYPHAAEIVRANLYNKNTEFYKDIYNQTLVLASVVQSLDIVDIKAVGDTFYCKMNFRMIHYGGHGTRRVEIPKTNLNNSAFLDTVKQCSFYPVVFIESKYNINAKYWKGELPDYAQAINTSEQVGYNKVYHLQNTLNATTIVDIKNNESRKNAGDYPTRVIRSVAANTEANTLNFRRYLATDYYDMPYQRKDIKSIIATSRNLYVIQELGTYIANVKDIISYQDGATYVGTGDIFDRQPTELITTKNGYVGCENYFNCGITDKGVWIIDNVQGKIFLITDNDIKIISDGKNQNWFKNNLTGNNPFKGQGCYITYDNTSFVKRLLLTIGTSGKTISYIPDLNIWYSFHDYRPRFGTYTRQGSYFFSDNETPISKFSNSNYGRHSISNTLYNSVISVFFNDNPENYKLIDSVSWLSKAIINGVNIYDLTFKDIIIHNDSQCTGLLSTVNNSEWFDNSGAILTNDVWSLNNIFDCVLDNKRPFLSDFMTLISSNLGSKNNSLEWFEMSKFMSTFVCITFIFDNHFYNDKGTTSATIEDSTNKYQPSVLLQDVIVKYSNTRR